MEKEGLSRRSFLTAGSAVLGTAVLGSMVGCASGTEANAKDDTGTEGAVGAEGAATSPDPRYWLGAEPEVAESSIIETKDTDLLIIGAGNGGLAAAATAADLGLDFIIAEASIEPAKTRSWYGAVNIPECTDAGLKVDTLRLGNELRRACGGKNDMRVTQVWINESVDMHLWMRDIMDSYGFSVNFDADTGESHGGVGQDMYVPPQQVNYLAREDCPEEYKDLARNQILEDYIQKKGYEVTYEYELTKLVHDGAGKVSGAIFYLGKESYAQINANAVVLATGGYPADPVMLEARNPILLQCLTSSNWWPTDKGQGIKAGLWAGALMDGSAMGMVFDRGAVPPGTKAGWTEESLEKGTPTLPTVGQFNPGTQPFLKMNTHGERFFNESGNYDWAPYAAAGQPGGVYIEVWDNNFKEDVKRFNSRGCASLTNVMVNLQGLEVDEYLADFLENGSLVKADTLEELADKLLLEGEKKENFLASIARYNELYEMKEDVDFGKESYLLSQIKDPPFYGVTLGGTLLSTGDGLRINADMQVLNTEGEPMEGLYATGDCSGSFFADGYYNLSHGMACGRTLTFARHAVLHAAGEIS